MGYIPEIWATYQKYGQHARNMVNIPEIWSTYQNYGQYTRNMANVPELGQHTRNTGNIPEVQGDITIHNLVSQLDLHLTFT